MEWAEEEEEKKKQEQGKTEKQDRKIHSDLDWETNCGTS